MEVKIKRQSLIHAVRSLEIVEKLPRNALQEFCKVFKVEGAINDYNSMLRGFQSKIVDIICQQGEGYEDYLQLPKFRVMGQQLNDRMHTLFRRIWEEQQLICQREQVNLARRELEDLTPNFQTNDQCSQFHLGLLQLYRSSSLCPRNSGKIQRKEQAKASPAESSNFVPVNNNLQNSAPIANQLGSNMFSYFPFPPPTTFPKLQAQEGMTYIVDNKHTQNLFELPRYPMQPTQFNPPLEFFPPIDPKRMFPQKQEDPQAKENAPQLEKMFAEDCASSIIQKFINYPFVQCACQAQKGFEDGLSFKCISCNYSYHYGCLKAQGSATEVAACPLCILRKNTIFCQVIKEPLKFSWFFQERAGRDLKVQMTMQQSQQVRDACKKGYQCHIRFLKIDGKSFKKDRKPLDGFTTQGGILQKEIKHSEIILPEISQQNKQPLALQITLKHQNQRDPSTKLYFFAVFLGITKQATDLVSNLFSSTNSQPAAYYNDFMDQSGKVQVSLLNTNSESRGSIKFPVRGINCRHAEVFDFKAYLELVIDLKRDRQPELCCPICSQPCPSFKFDAFIRNCIENFPEYEEKKPEAIQIERNGQYAWVLDNPPEPQVHNEKVDGQIAEGIDNFMIEDPESEDSKEERES